MCLLRGLRSFQRGTVGLCRSIGVKIARCQSWRFKKNLATRPTSNHTSAARVRFPDDGIILQFLQLATLQPVDLQRPTVPLWKDLNLFNIYSINKLEFKDRLCSLNMTLFPQCLCYREVLISFWLAVLQFQ